MGESRRTQKGHVRRNQAPGKGLEKKKTETNNAKIEMDNNNKEAYHQTEDAGPGGAVGDAKEDEGAIVVETEEGGEDGDRKAIIGDNGGKCCGHW